MKVELKPPTRFYTRAEINRAFGLGDVDTANAAIGIAGVLAVVALGIVGTGLTTYFVWRVAKKQRWV